MTTTFSHARIRNAIENAVRNIGTTNGTRRPELPINDNRAHIAYKFAVARMVRRIAGALYETATKEALEAGVLFDHKKQPMKSGQIKVLYQDEVVTVTCTTSTPHDLLNRVKLRELLHERFGVTGAEFDKLMKDSTSPSAAPHEFNASISSPEEKEM